MFTTECAGAINHKRNQAYWESHGDELLGGRYEALSYAISAGSVSAQLDLIMDGATDTGKSIDGSAFGMTAALGDIGKLSVGYEKKEDATTTMAVMGATPSKVAGENALKFKVTDGKVDKTGSTLVFRTKDGRMIISDAVVTHTITTGADGKSHTATLEVVNVATTDKDQDGTIYKIGGKYYSAGCTDGNGKLNAGTTPCGTGATTEVRYVTSDLNQETEKGKTPTAHTYMAYRADDADQAMLANKGFVDRRSDWAGKRDDRNRQIDGDGYYWRWVDSDPDVEGLDVEGISTLASICSLNSGQNPASGCHVYVGANGEPLTVMVDADNDPSTPDVTRVIINTYGDATDNDDESVATGSSSVSADGRNELVKSPDLTDQVSIAHTATGNLMDTVYGAKKTHISAEFGLGAVTLGLGHSQEESNDPMVTGKTKTNYLGMQGSLGDTGLNWLAWGRSVEAPSGTKTNPWMVGINKSLGGGAFTFVEHTNADDDSGGTTHVAFGVNF